MVRECCDNPDIRTVSIGSVFTTYGEYDDDIRIVEQCINCGKILEED